MRHSILFLALLLAAFASLAQPRTKQVLVEGSGPAIVLLHGGTFDMNAYARHAKLLADSFTVIRMQQFNVQYANEGRPLPADYRLQQESEAISATLDSLGINGPIILAGHSYGGVIAFDFAMHHPERVRALVLIEPPLYDLARAKGQFTEQMKGIDELTKNFTGDATITEDMVKGFRCKLMNCDTFDIHRHPMWMKWVEQKNRLRGLAVVPGYKVDLQQLHSFIKPVFVITGNTTIDANRRVDSLLAREFMHVVRGSLPGDHISVYQQPILFAQMVRTFVAQNEH